MENLQTLTSQEAARAFVACAGLDPQNQATPESAAEAGDCYRLDTEHGSLVYSLNMGRAVAWVNAAAGIGRGMTFAGLRVIEQQAKRAGCSVVGFQTVRRGLVKLAERKGYEVHSTIGRGVVMTKEIA